MNSDDYNFGLRCLNMSISVVFSFKFDYFLHCIGYIYFYSNLRMVKALGVRHFYYYFHKLERLYYNFIGLLLFFEE